MEDIIMDKESDKESTSSAESESISQFKKSKFKSKSKSGADDWIENDKAIWTIIDRYFTDNPNILIKHHLDSFNQFYDKTIKNIFKEKNPVQILKEFNEVTGEYGRQVKMYFAGRNGDKIHYGKPIIFDENRQHYMFPNEARIRNMTYGITLHIDIDLEYRITDDEGNLTETTSILEKVYLGRFPIMLNSDLCVLNKMDRHAKYNLGECKNDLGGYFIIDGKEKLIISQEKFADNMLYIRDKYNDIYSHSAEIRSVSEDASKPIRTFSIRIVTPSASFSNNNIVVNIPNVRKPIPLFILMRALGVESDREIIEHCILDLDKNADYVDLFIPSVHDANRIFTQITALKYIATFTKGKTIPQVMYILMDYLLPHIGELNFREKALFIGHMVFELLKVFKGVKRPTDRDSFNFKRVELPGTLIYDLFKEYYTLQQKHVFQTIDKEYYYKQGIYKSDFYSLIENNANTIFQNRILEAGFRRGFKGNWGAEAHTSRPGLVQDLNRLSFNSALSHMRKLNLPIDASAKVVGPRLLHGSQWGLIDPVDTPDGGNIGFHKHLAISASITSGYSAKPLVALLRSIRIVDILTEVTVDYLSTSCKIFVNGAWIGSTRQPVELVKIMKIYRRNGLIPVFTSISWNIREQSIYFYTDSGRIVRPCFYVEDEKPSYTDKRIYTSLLRREFTGQQLVSGSNPIKSTDTSTIINQETVYQKIDDLYQVDSVDRLVKNQAIIDYLDTAECETCYIATTLSGINSKTTNLEIHPSLLLGIMGNQIVFPENNQLPRNLFSCGQSKQAVSLYHSNFNNRIDKMGVVLNNGEIPLIKSRYMRYINNEEHPYGFNTIVAIGCYGGYNVEDSILFNEGSVKRGMFRTTYFNMYETYEESSKVGNNTIDSKFANIEDYNVVGMKPGYEYSNLNKHGLIEENTIMDDKKVVIGKITNNPQKPGTYIDNSITPKKGQLGYVDKSFITDGEEGFRIAKVRIREERLPAIGDKFCSRCGQKGTVGQIIPEANMPFTEDGIRPDIIINPHALPSRMTIGQLVETILGKVCAHFGNYGDCTAFVNQGNQQEVYGKLLNSIGFKSSGNELLYNGETGEQLESEIFIGPCYYMRLKHMVKDKINYRAQGPRTVLTRQTVQGRANDGGLRIGEMERDGVIAHGATAFLKQSMLDRGDDYYVAICNKTGTIAAYNSSKNIFYSLFADGPLKFNGSTVDTLSIQNISQFGRSFSIVRIPYCFKLLLHELQCMNVQMRIITEDNIDQFDSMAFEYTRFIDQEKIVTGSLSTSNRSKVKTSMKIDKSSILDVSDSEGDVDNDSVIKISQDLDKNEPSGIDEDDDESDLSPETIESIRRAEEYAASMTDDDSEEDLEPVSLGEDLSEDALGLENIDGDNSNSNDDKLSKEISDIKNTIEANSQEQQERLDTLEKSVNTAQLKSKNIVIEDKQEEDADRSSILLVDDIDDNNNNDNDTDNDNQSKTKPIIIG
jgi:DNA-directed RNA polymerase II subunit RPB2